MRRLCAVLEFPRARSIDPLERLRTCIAFAKPDPCRTVLYRPDPLLEGRLVAPKKGFLRKRIYRLRQIVKWY